MVGYIHKVLFDLVEALGGADAALEVRRRAGIPADREFRMSAVYDDDEWRRLVAATCNVLDVTVPQAEEAYAQAFLRDARARWPVWFSMSRNSREFLERQPAIHNSLAAGLTDEASREAIRDKFRLDSTAAGIVAHYRSPNRHCGLYKALARCIVDHYGDEAVIHERGCMHAGAAECEIHVEWKRLGGTA